MSRSNGNAFSLDQPVLIVVSQKEVTVKDKSGNGQTIIVRVTHQPRGYKDLTSIVARGQHPNRKEKYCIKPYNFGWRGFSGSDGVDGRDGADGGGDGTPGTDATPGMDGHNGGDRHLVISGSPSCLKTDSTTEQPVALLGEVSRENIMIMAKGGDGGDVEGR